MYCSKSTPQWKEECGVVGVWSPGEAVAHLCYRALFALQHRGQESAGIAVTDGTKIDLEKGVGLMRDVFSSRSNRMPGLAGHTAVGHVRYSNLGSSLYNDIQPIYANYSEGFFCLANNGCLTNAQDIRKSLLEEGCIFQTTTDAELILNLIARSSAVALEDKIADSVCKLEGAYCFVVMSGDKLIGVRDPYGFRPFCLGRLAGGGYILASETCALDTVDAEFVRDVVPGEMISIDKNGYTSRIINQRERTARCIFEYIYFARPDSVFDGFSVWKARYRMGQQLAREFKDEADIVTAVPDSGVAAAYGFAAESGVPFVEGLIRNRYVERRSFILSDQQERRNLVEKKLIPVRANLEGKRVILVDDSIVRGTTSQHIVEIIREAGATEVHFTVASPPITHPCRYGIGDSIRKGLIASEKSPEEIKIFLRTDSLYHLSKEGLLAAVDDPGGERMCMACFTGCYPTAIDSAEGDGSSKGCANA